MFAATYFGQTYFSGEPGITIDSVPCGGNYFGAPYFGQTPMCGDVIPSPSPPEPVIPAISGGGIFVAPHKRGLRPLTPRKPRTTTKPRVEPTRRPYIPEPERTVIPSFSPDEVFAPQPDYVPSTEFTGESPVRRTTKTVDTTPLVVAPYDESEAEAILTILALL